MGLDKANLVVKGEPLGLRIVRLLSGAAVQTTVLGRPVPGAAAHIPDKPGNAGPLAALSLFQPKASRVFIISCDVPLFDPRLLAFFDGLMRQRQAVVPKIEGKPQPFCALYKAECFSVARAVVDTGDQRALSWLRRLDVLSVDANKLQEGGLECRFCQGANTPDEFKALVELA